MAGREVEAVIPHVEAMAPLEVALEDHEEARIKHSVEADTMMDVAIITMGEVEVVQWPLELVRGWPQVP